MVAATCSTSSAFVMRPPLLPDKAPASRRDASWRSIRCGAYAPRRGCQLFSSADAVLEAEHPALLSYPMVERFSGKENRRAGGFVPEIMHLDNVDLSPDRKSIVSSA